MTELEPEAIEAALVTAHGRTVSPSKEKWPDGYVNEDYPYKPFWSVFTDSLENRLQLYKQKDEPTDDNQAGLNRYE